MNANTKTIVFLNPSDEIMSGLRKWGLPIETKSLYGGERFGAQYVELTTHKVTVREMREYVGDRCISFESVDAAREYMSNTTCEQTERDCTMRGALDRPYDR